MAAPRISFGLIALNGHPFLEYNLRALYPFAHQIIVAEGAVKAAVSLARPDGHSSDGTWELLQDFQRDRDPEGKLVLVSAADEGHVDGFWPEKDEMSQAYARRVSGDWLWQVDVDEFYRQTDMQAVLALLEEQPEITAVSFPYHEFWGGFDYVLGGQWHRYIQPACDRLFRWKPGYRYATHRPPTVLDEAGRDLREQAWLGHRDMRARGIWLYHYSYVFPQQAEQKVGYYSNVGWTDAFRENARWLEEQYYGLKSPLFLGEKGYKIWQWLERYSGQHPAAIQQLRADLATGKLELVQRRTDDIEALLDSFSYRLMRPLARLYLSWVWNPWRRLKNWFRRVVNPAPAQ